MSETNLQVKLFQQLKNLLPGEEKFVLVIMEHLQLTRSQAYRRINGTVPVSLNELSIFVKTFGLSLDDLLLDQTDGLIKFSAALRINDTYLGFLQQLHQTISFVSELKDAEIQYATNEFPIFYTFMFPDLVKFKLYMWNRTFWKNTTSQLPFSLNIANFDELELARKIREIYLSLSTTEFWHLRLVDNTFSQIGYALESGFFKEPEEAYKLIEQLERGLQHVKSMVVHGKKRFLEDTETTSRADFNLYLSELPTNVHFLVTQPTSQQLFSTFDNPNFMHTRNRAICNYTANWFENLQKKSVLISQSGHKARNQFFHRLEQEIEELKK